MTINLPTSTHPARQHIDIAATVAMLHPDERRKLPTLRNALMSASDFFKAEPASKSVTVVCWKCDGRIVLERINKRGGHKTLWVFAQA